MAAIGARCTLTVRAERPDTLQTSTGAEEACSGQVRDVAYWPKSEAKGDGRHGSFQG
jgi:hypothetical protein